MEITALTGPTAGNNERPTADVTESWETARTSLEFMAVVTERKTSNCDDVARERRERGIGERRSRKDELLQRVHALGAEVIIIDATAVSRGPSERAKALGQQTRGSATDQTATKYKHGCKSVVPSKKERKSRRSEMRTTAQVRGVRNTDDGQAHSQCFTKFTEFLALTTGLILSRYMTAVPNRFSCADHRFS